MIRYKMHAVVMLAIILLLLPLFVFSTKEDYKILAARSGMPANKEFVIQFESPIRETSINSNNVYVLDKSGHKIAVEAKLSINGKNIIIKPVKPYKNDNSYTLYIGKTVRYATGVQLKQGLKMYFDIAPFEEGLPVVASRKNLLRLLSDVQKEMDLMSGKEGGIRGFVNDLASGIPWAKSAKTESAVYSAPAAQEQNTGSSDFSATNVQVQGVDEADIVKTDGEYIYQVRYDSIVISKAYPADKLQIIKTLWLNGARPLELYVDDGHLIVISDDNLHSYSNEKNRTTYYIDNTVSMKIYNILDKSNIYEEREIVLDGSYLSSRKVDQEVYLITNKHINYGYIKDNTIAPDTPMYRDSQSGEDFVKTDYKDVKYFPDSLVSSYMVIAGLSLDTPKEKLFVDTYLGAGEEIYCSPENLYVAVTKHRNLKAENNGPIMYDSAVSKKPSIRSIEKDTALYKFALNRGKLEHVANGVVPGEILNQFSMDEYDNSFRIATTTGEMWSTGDNISKNNLYVLDNKLKQVGELRDIAPGEKIYSVRFMGDRAYMVTFRTVDPLFVIDIKDKTKPQILGALKIPGYSDYLHPYDENHIIGFGKDTTEMGGGAYYLGMKVAMFDITDVNNPKELFVEKIGDRGTESPLLRDHKALLFSKEKDIMAFPVTVMKVQEGSQQGYQSHPEYGSFNFQGAYVYNVDLQKGFRLKGKITHITDEEYKKAGQYWYEEDRFIQRILYIGDNLYTTSNDLIKVNDINNLREINSLQIK